MNQAATARTLEPSLLDALRALVAECLRVPVAAIGPDVPLARLGLDSLGCMDLAARVEDVLGRRIPSDALIESMSVRSLCEALERPDVTADDQFARMRADARLPDDIVPMGPRRLHADLRVARTILLTGATGFLGSSLLRALLHQTPARVLCLVRPTRDAAADRVRRIARDASVDGGRIETIEGDLAQDRLGLQMETWRALTGRVDAVCHAGASISWVTPYDGLRAVNVTATRELLRLACEANAAFHFISSLSVCYSTTGPRQVDERFDPLRGLEGLHFGYAHSKAVAEALVAQARQRGLRTRVYRPALIAGDSRTGRFNPDDLLSTLIAGCVRMTTIPDLDWHLDAVPVDTVADAIIRLSSSALPTLHIAHPRPRHWRELALWMRLYGYDVRLVPYRDWLAQLGDETAHDPSHPLRALRSFFLDRTREGLSIPELHERSRRSDTDSETSLRALADARGFIPALDAKLIDRYFDAFVREGRLPRPVHRTPRASTRREPPSPTSLARQLLDRANLPSRHVIVDECGSDESIISELTAWRSKSSSGVFRVRAREREFILKIKPHAREAIAVGQALAELCGGRHLGDAYARWGFALGVDQGHARELAIYADGAPAFRAHLPKVFATHADPADGIWAQLAERVRDTPKRWKRPHVAAAVDGIAAIHARWSGCTGDLQSQPWIGTIRRTRLVIDMDPLWRALAQHAAPLFSAIDPSLPALQARLIDAIALWRPAQDALPQTLVHNDFNPRNIRLRREDGRWTLCAFDWELAAIGAPPRDLAELLCFVCPSTVTRAEVDGWIERHRRALSERTREPIDPLAWRAGFGSALCELLIDRFAVYALVHRVKPQMFLPRVLRTWTVLFEMTRHAIAA